MNYNRDEAVLYAKKWALSRNTSYYDYSNLGGDCTNFCSQSLYAGAPVMNNTKTFGWYYLSANNKAPAWTGVNEFFNFLVNNKTKGPYGKLSSFYEIEKGDFVQLGNNQRFYHTLIISDFNNSVPLVCSHSIDRLNTPLSAYNFERLRFIKIMGVNN